MKKIIFSLILTLSIVFVAFAQNYDKQGQFCASVNNYYAQGYRGGGVKEVQWMLQQYNAPWLQATDYYGPVTAGAVRSFQKIHGIRATGTVGPITLSKMRNLWCSSNISNPPTGINCTQEVKYCSNGQIMQRDNNCAWREDLCYTNNNNSLPIISVSPISSIGNNVTIAWSTTNASSCTINGEYVSTSGNKIYTIYSETSYRIVCQNSYGSSEKILTLRPNSINNNFTVPTANLYLNSTNLISGQNYILSWDSQNANTCTLNGNTVSLSGNQTIYYSGVNTVYNLICTGNGGSMTKSITLNSSNTSSGNINLDKSNLNIDNILNINWSAPSSYSSVPQGVILSLYDSNNNFVGQITRLTNNGTGSYSWTIPEGLSNPNNDIRVCKIINSKNICGGSPINQIVSGTYKIRATFFTPSNACFGFCLQVSGQTTLGYIESSNFFINGNNSNNNSNINLTTTFNKTSFSRGEYITVNVTVRNNGNTTISYPSGSSSCPSDVQLTVNGVDFYNYINQANRICTADYQYVNLAPGQSYSRSFSGTIPYSAYIGNQTVIVNLLNNSQVLTSTTNNIYIAN